MAALQIQNFSGLYPKLSDRLLPDNAATYALNCILTSGEIKALRYPTLTYDPPTAGPYTATYRAEWNGSEKWRVWTMDVDCAVAPLPQDVEQRYYWTGDGCPRYAKFTDFGTTDYALGLPKPATAPSASHTGGTGSAVTRIYCYTYYNPNTGEESGKSPDSTPYTGKVDGTWTISSFDNAPLNSGTYTGVYSAPSTTCTTATPHFLRVGDLVTINSTQYEVTSVTSTTFKVTGNVAAYTSWARVVNWNVSGLYQRLYRSAGTNATYQLVAERAAATGNWTDTLTDAQIMGDELISHTWEPPLASLRGIGFLPNGAAYGFSGNLLCFSEPYQPHAWPPEYQFATDHQIVGCASFGTAVVAATEAYPYIADGVEPASVTLNKQNDPWPCLSKRSVVNLKNGVLYATYQGLAYIGIEGPAIWTQQLYTSEEWSSVNPETMIAAVADGRIFCLYTTDADETAVLVFSPGESAVLTELILDMTMTELYVDARTGNFYLCDDAGVWLWNSSPGEKMSYTWRSKEFVLPNPVNFGAGKIDFDTSVTTEDLAAADALYQGDLAANTAAIAAGAYLADYGSFLVGEYEVGEDDLTTPRVPSLIKCAFTLYADKEEKITRDVITEKPFRLPAGYKAERIQVQITGNVDVKAVKLAETVIGLKQI